MKKLIILTLAIIISFNYSEAQVGVNSSNTLYVTKSSGNHFNLNNSGETYSLNTNATGQLAFRPNGSSTAYSLILDDEAPYQATFNGIVDLRQGSASGIALRVDGAEALYSNANYFSWGYGKDYNYFNDEITINGSSAPSELDGITIYGNEDIRLDGTGGKYLRFTEGSTSKGYVGHAGTHMYLHNNETAGDTYIRTTDDIHLAAGGTGTDVLIDQDGRVGVGTTAPTQDIHIADAGNVAGLAMERTDAGNFLNLFSGTTGNAFVYKNTKRFTIGSVTDLNATTPPAASAMYLYGTSWPTVANRGNVGIGTNAPASKLHVNGDIQYTGALISSDARLKSDVNDFNYGLKELMRINPVHFTYNGRGSTTAGDKHVGVIAQELQKVAPELVESYTHVTYKEQGEEDTEFESQEEFLRIRDTEIKYMIINAVKEQQETISALKEENSMLTDRLDELAALVSELQTGKTTTKTEAIKSMDSQKSITLKSASNDASLEQNIPNPFGDATQIDYVIPKDAKQATMLFHDQNGKVVYQTSLAPDANGSINIDAEELKSGFYTYSLIIDGQVIETKKMQKVN